MDYEQHLKIRIFTDVKNRLTNRLWYHETFRSVETETALLQMFTIFKAIGRI